MDDLVDAAEGILIEFTFQSEIFRVQNGSNLDLRTLNPCPLESLPVSGLSKFYW